MFRAASVRLASLYLLIIMVVSILFSMSIYQLSVQELDRGLRGPETVIINSSSRAMSDEILAQFRLGQTRQYEQAKNRVAKRLVLVNLMILVAGGFLSYYLARRTLVPIEAAHEAQRRFTGDASHELRTPIAAMQSETEVTLMDPKLTVARAKKQLQSNLEELAKLTALSESLLRLANQEANVLPKLPVRIDTVVEQAIGRVLPFAEKKHILIHAPDAAQLRALGDTESLVEVVVILLDNAIKYSPENSEIRVAVKVMNKCVALTIHDQGIGISSKDLPHIFDRFYRADAARSKQNTHGYGLGLAIAKNIIEQQGGEITAKSQPGKSTTFTVKLLRQ